MTYSLSMPRTTSTRAASMKQSTKASNRGGVEPEAIVIPCFNGLDPTGDGTRAGERLFWLLHRQPQ